MISTKNLLAEVVATFLREDEEEYSQRHSTHNTIIIREFRKQARIIIRDLQRDGLTRRDLYGVAFIVNISTKGYEEITIRLCTTRDTIQRHGVKGQLFSTRLR